MSVAATVLQAVVAAFCEELVPLRLALCGCSSLSWLVVGDSGKNKNSRLYRVASEIF